MSAENPPEFAIRTLTPTPANISAAIGIVDSAGVNIAGVDASGRFTVKIEDTSGNSITSTAGNLNIDINAQSIGAVKVSRDNTVNSATHGLFANILQGDAVISATHGLFTNILQGDAVISATHGLFTNILQGDAVLTAANPVPVQASQGGAVLSATNGLFSNILQGNVVLSATHGLFTNVLQGDAALTAANPLPERISADGTNFVAVTHPLFVELSDGTNPFGTSGNPIFVSSGNVSGTPKRLTVMGANITKGTSTDADFTVPGGKTWTVYEIEMSPGESGHFTVILDPAGANTTVGVYFTQGGATYRKAFRAPVAVPTLTTGMILRVTRNNDSNQDAKFSVNVLVVEV